LRNVVKPVIELMAAMPSVVVGFLAALWLAPLLERNLIRFITGALAVPFGLATAIGCWYLLPCTSGNAPSRASSWRSWCRS
jgi:phosphate transport system permease protein